MLQDKITATTVGGYYANVGDVMKVCGHYYVTTNVSDGEVESEYFLEMERISYLKYQWMKFVASITSPF